MRVHIALALLIPTYAQWPQFGGPHGDFIVDGKGIAPTGPVGGPRELWKRVVGEGYSGVVVDKGVLYTMYSRDREEVVSVDYRFDDLRQGPRFAVLLRRLRLDRTSGDPFG